MRTQRRRNPRGDHPHRVRFEKRTALATGLSAALVLTPEYATAGTDRMNLLQPQSEWKAAAAPIESVGRQEFVGESNNSEMLQIPPIEKQWTEADNRRFEDLAIQEAVGGLSAEEAQELEELATLRRFLERPRSGDEVLWEFEQRRRTNELLTTLRRYVEFYEG